jgi:hypothetical protein
VAFASTDANVVGVAASCGETTSLTITN